MKIVCKSKPIKFTLIVGGRECRSIDDVKRNFKIDDVVDSMHNGNLEKWLKQIKADNNYVASLETIKDTGVIEQKFSLYHLFCTENIQMDKKNILNLWANGIYKYSELRKTEYFDDSYVDTIDEVTLNCLCERDLDFLKYCCEKQKLFGKLNDKNRDKAVTEDYLTNETLNKLCEKDLDFLKYCCEKQKLFGKLNDKNRDKAVTEGYITNTNVIIGGYECVDLGLPSGTLWATCNVGANSPEKRGTYYAWGESSIKGIYLSHNYSKVGKFNGKENELFTDKDAARVNWGCNWRMPTKKEFVELINKCTYKWDRIKGTRGVKLTGPNGKYIFFPAAGSLSGKDNPLNTFGSYWSSSNATPDNAWTFEFFPDNTVQTVPKLCCVGRLVRPVCVKKAIKNDTLEHKFDKFWLR